MPAVTRSLISEDSSSAMAAMIVNMACPMGGQRKRAVALNLVIAAITFWNTVYMDKAASHLARTSPLHDQALLPHASPLGWEHIILSGDFGWHSGAAERKIARSLRIRSTEMGVRSMVR